MYRINRNFTFTFRNMHVNFIHVQPYSITHTYFTHALIHIGALLISMAYTAPKIVITFSLVLSFPLSFHGLTPIIDS